MEKVIGVSIQSILEMDVLKDAKVLAGHAGLERLITSMNVMEVPDIINWVSKGELLITTAYSIKDDVQILLEIIPKLNASGVVGLGIKSKRYIKEVPKEVIDIADRLSFPIFDIPADVSFSKIITPVLSTIVDNQTKVLSDIYDLQRALTATMLSGGNLQEISQTLYQKFGNSVAIYNDFFSSYVISTTEEKRDEICKIIESEKKLNFAGVNNISFDTTRDSTREKNSIGGQLYNRIVIPIFSDKKLYGHIFMWEDKRELTSVELSVIESATSLIALDLVKKMSMFEMENNHKAGFIDNLLSNDDALFSKAISNAGYFDFNLDLMHQVVIVQLHSINKNFVLSSGALYRINNNIVSLLRQISKNTIFKMMFVNKCDSIILLCESTPQSNVSYKQAFSEFMKSFSEALKNENIQNLVTIGIGRSYEKANELWRSLAEARRAASCSKTNGEAVYFEDLGIFRFLSSEDLKPELTAFYNETLKPLVDYDRERDSELVKTLATYFKCNGNLKKLAEEMFVHYNTIVYRMQRIRELTGSDLQKSDELLNFQIAIKIYEMQENA